MSRIAPAAAAATMSGRMGIGLDLDVDDFTDQHEADEHHEAAEEQDHHAERQAESFGGLVEQRTQEVGAPDEQEPRQPDRQEADDIAGQPLLGGQRADLALDPDALANRE